MKSKNNLEVLLLLCCLVGVVMFLCFAMAAINLGAAVETSNQKMPDVEALIRTRDQLIETRQSRSEENSKLDDQISYLKGRIAADEQKFETMQRNRSFDRLARDIETTRRDLEEVDRKLKEASKDLAVKKEEIGKFTWKNFAGMVRFENPLILECRDKVVVIHPAKKVLNLSDINKGNAIPELAKGYDGLVLLVRPSGFDIFQACFLQARKAGLAMAYEPVETEKLIDFSIGRR